MSNEEKEKKTIIQNVELEDTINGVVDQCTKNVFEKLIKLDNLKNITEDFVNKVVTELKTQSFMTLELELTEIQKEFLFKELPMLMSRATSEYQSKLNKETRTKETILIVENELKKIIEETLRSIAQEINRGAIINSTAVSADTKSKDYNKIELNFSKRSGDITIPTKGVFISTNCIDIILNSIKVEGEEVTEPSEDQEN